MAVFGRTEYGARSAEALAVLAPLVAACGDERMRRAGRDLQGNAQSLFNILIFRQHLKMKLHHFQIK